MNRSELCAHIVIAFVPGVLALMFNLPGLLIGIVIVLVWIISSYKMEKK